MTGGIHDEHRAEVRIPMDDGVELAATLYLPDVDLGPQPCILEALPYRKDDLTSSYRPDYVRLRDEYAYAVCRLDLRGTGSSGGDATDEYPVREQQDLAAVLSWLAGQPWCDGSLGMYGTSYSGFNSLQMACERPPELKAIIAIFATDDRYTDDVHYRGGALKFVDLVDYNHYVTAMNALPPVPAVWGPHWRDEWRRRVETCEPWLLTWMREQRDGPYWRHGSVRPDYARIDCPTMIVAGWADGYRNSTFRLVEALGGNGVPHRLLAGPWAHAATDSSRPGPRIDLVPEMVAWWDRWLRGDVGPLRKSASLWRPRARCSSSGRRHGRSLTSTRATVSGSPSSGPLRVPASRYGTWITGSRTRSARQSVPTPGSTAPAIFRGGRASTSVSTTPRR